MSFDADTYSRMPHFVSRDTSLTFQQKIIYCEILNLSQRTGYCYAITDEICEAVGVPKENSRNIKHQIGELKKKGLFRIEYVGNERRIFPLRNLKERMDDKNHTLRDDKNHTLKERMGDKNHTQGCYFSHPRGDKNHTLPCTPISVKEERKKREEEEPVCATPPNLQSQTSEYAQLDEPPKPIVARFVLSDHPVSSVAPLPHPSAFAPLMSEPPFFRNFKNTRLTESEYAQLCGEFGTKFVDERLPRFDKTAQFFKGSHYEKLLEWCKKDYDISKDDRLEKKIPPVRNPETRPKIESTSHFRADDAEITQKNRHFTEQFVLREKIIAPFVEILPFGVVCKVPGKLKFMMQWIEPGFQSQFDGWFRKADLDGSFSFHGVKTH